MKTENIMFVQFGFYSSNKRLSMSECVCVCVCVCFANLRANILGLSFHKSISNIKSQTFVIIAFT